MINLDNIVNNASKEIRKGNLVIFPTETVYGIGADSTNPKAVNKIFKAKNRPADNPLIVHIGSKSQLNDFVIGVGEIEQRLIEHFWPGALTILFKRNKKAVPDIITAGSDFVGVRIPSNEIAIRLIQEAGVPIAAPSANISGRVSPTSFDLLDSELIKKVGAVIDGGECKKGLESTVLKVINNKKIKILRPGAISLEDIQDFTSTFDSSIRVEYSLSHESIRLSKTPKDLIKAKNSSKNKIFSPGTKYKHYSPSTRLKLFKIEESNYLETIKKIVEQNSRVAVLGKSELKVELEAFFGELMNTGDLLFLDLGSETNLDEIAKNLYAKLIELDKSGVDIGLIHLFNDKGLGFTINDRIIRATMK